MMRGKGSFGSGSFLRHHFSPVNGGDGSPGGTAAHGETSDATHTLAFEIGVEEMPARFITPILEQLDQRTRERLEGAGLPWEDVRLWATPRRLIVLVTGLAAKQDPREELFRGPSRKIAFDEDGAPTRAAAGFARGHGVEVADLIIKDEGQGEYVYARQVEEGLPAAAVLPEALTGLIGDLAFPGTTMRWGSGKERFIRPVRWLLALLDDEVLPVAFGHVTSSNQTYGHRTLAPGPHTVATAAELPQALRQAGIVAPPEERQKMMTEQVAAAARAAGGQAVMDTDLVEEVTHLVEHPHAFIGRFDEKYLGLPEELLVTVMKAHQRYFPVVDGETGRLLPMFAAVRNGDDLGIDGVCLGNERVLAARLADARFFYDEDLKTPLEDLVQHLDGVMFREGLGSLLDKTRRLEELADFIAGEAGYSEEGRAMIRRAAHLAKADQVTFVVNELPELEGVMGRQYALAAGEDEKVAQAIEEHYMPRAGAAGLPETAAGFILALADRADTLVGSFALGLEPSGSQDPYGLRRQAAGLLSLLQGRGMTIPLHDIFARAYDGYGAMVEAGEKTEHLARLMEFCRTRLEGQMRSAEIPQDVVSAVLARGWSVIPEVWSRARAVADLLTDEEMFADVYTVFLRASNLAGRSGDEPVNPDLFTEPAEGRLNAGLMEVMPEARAMLAAEDYAGYFSLVARLRPLIDEFFDDVLVMAEDEAVRANRLALMRDVADLAGRGADLSKLIVS